MNETKVILKYIGGGSLFNVPARDLTDLDFKERAEEWQEQGWNEESLAGTGLYQYAIETAQVKDTRTSTEKPKRAKEKDGE